MSTAIAIVIVEFYVLKTLIYVVMETKKTNRVF